MKQLPLRQAPKIEPETGLHAVDCECPRCEAGNRPTMAQRWAARRAQERAKAARDAATAQGVTPDELSAAEKRKAEAAERTRLRREREQRETEARLQAEREARARCRVPPDEEIEELRRMFGLKPPRKRG